MNIDFFFRLLFNQVTFRSNQNWVSTIAFFVSPLSKDNTETEQGALVACIMSTAFPIQGHANTHSKSEFTDNEDENGLDGVEFVNESDFDTLALITIVLTFLAQTLHIDSISNAFRRNFISFMH